MIQTKALLVKDPFKRVVPKGDYRPRPIINGDYSGYMVIDYPLFEIVSQADFVRELYPSGHKINDPMWYPDKMSYLDTDEVREANNGKGAWVTERVTRTTVPFQFIILLKHLIHLGGNPVNIMSSNRVQTEADKSALAELRQGWVDKNMETAKWDCFKSAKAVGDTACVMYFDKNGKVKYKVLSYLNGDTLYPHYNTKGDLEMFAREFKMLSEDGRQKVSYIEVWDDKHTYLLKKDDTTAVKKIKNFVYELFGLDGYSMVGEPSLHGFNRIPIVYKRLNGPCWSFVQRNIDDYELSLSQLCESNKVYAFPILVMVGGDADVSVSSNGRPFAITSSDPDAKISMLNNNGNSGTESFKLQIETQYKTIMMGSFIVTPPEVRSGDLPGVAIKLIYSPALEHAMNDAKEWDVFIDEMFELFTYGYGIEKKMSAQFSKLEAHANIVPYVHENTSEMIQLLSQSVLSNILSVETAIEKNPFSMTDEQKRVLQQKVDENMVTPNMPEGMNANNMAKQKTE